MKVVLGTCNGEVSVWCGGVGLMGERRLGVTGGYEGSDGRGRGKRVPAGEAMVRSG